MKKKGVFRGLRKKLSWTRTGRTRGGADSQNRFNGKWLESPEYSGQKAATYLEKRAKTTAWKLEHEAVVSKLVDLPREIRVLDVPIGGGRFVQEYAQRGLDIYGIDVSEEMMGQIPKTNEESVKFQVGDARTLPYPDDYFDLVVSFRFLGYILSLEDAILAMKEIRRVSRKWALLHLQAVSEGFSSGKTPKMGHRLAQSDVILLLRDIGFSPLEVTTTSQKGEVINFVVFCEVV